MGKIICHLLFVTGGPLSVVALTILLIIKLKADSYIIINMWWVLEMLLCGARSRQQPYSVTAARQNGVTMPEPASVRNTW